MTVVSSVPDSGLDASHSLFSEVEEDVMGTTLVMGGFLVIERGSVSLVAGFELVVGGFGLRDLGDGLVLVHVTHELEDGSSSDQSANGADLLDDASNGGSIFVLGSLNTGLSLGSNESPDGDGKEVECLLVLVILSGLV